ncbi:MAG: hypothetical protein IKI36_01285 [Prevotella sp.]|nr:hypothetical protein [Prevotella sp.]
MTYYKISHALLWLAVLATTALLCFSCGKNTNANGKHTGELSHIDNLISVSPDSALYILHGMKDDASKWPESERMHYDLMTIKATDKARLPLGEDSAINKIVDYYESHPDKYLLSTAYYYAGRTNMQQNDALLALDFLNKSFELISKDSINPLNNHILSNIGYIYRNQGFFMKEREIHRKALRYAQIAKDTVGIIFNIRDIGGTYESLENYDSCNWYLHAALKLAEMAQNDKMIKNIKTSLTDNYKYLNRYDSAKYFLQHIIKDVPPSSQSPVFTNAAEIYAHENMNDSARYYADKVLQIGNIYGKRDVCLSLTRLDLRRHDMEGARRNFEKFVAFSDSAERMKSEMALANAMSLYDYSEYVKEKEIAKAESQRKNIWLWMISIVCAALGLSTFYLINNFKKKKNKEEIKRRMLEAIIKKKESESNNIIIEKQKKIDELNEKIRKIGINNEKNISILKKEKEELEEELEKEKDRVKQIFEREKIEKFNDIKLKLEKEAKENQVASNELISEMRAFFTFYYSDFLTKLNSFVNPNDTELIVCMMLKLNIKLKHIAVLISHSMQSISTMRARLYKRAFNKNAAAEEFDKFIDCL